MSKILVSACLLGMPVRYNGSAKSVLHHALEEWQAEGRLVSICPELTAGFNVPRPPAEIQNYESGEGVLSGGARVLEVTGEDVTEGYIAGAKAAAALAIANGCAFALLVDGSPSCGTRFIYDGSFSGRRHDGMGVTAALLKENGIEVFSETEIDLLQARLSQKN